MTQVKLDDWLGERKEIRVGLDLRFYMRSWLRLDTSISYTFRKYMEEIKEETLDEMRHEWAKHGFARSEKVVFFEFKK